MRMNNNHSQSVALVLWCFGSTAQLPTIRQTRHDLACFAGSHTKCRFGAFNNFSASHHPMMSEWVWGCGGQRQRKQGNPNKNKRTRNQKGNLNLQPSDGRPGTTIPHNTAQHDRTWLTNNTTHCTQHLLAAHTVLLGRLSARYTVNGGGQLEARHV